MYRREPMLRLYDYWESGNCYKVRLVLAQLGLDYECVPIDILKGETRTPEFLARNPNHRVPTLEWPDGRCLWESNAILLHLAEGTPLLSTDPWQRAQTFQWLSFEQYSHEPYIAVLRFWHFAGLLDENRDAIPAKLEGGYDALGVMEGRLRDREFFVDEGYGIADIALYAYTHAAEEGGFELARFPAVQAWLERVRAQPGHVLLEASRPEA